MTSKDEYVTFKKINLKYISTKTDKFDNEIAYYEVLNDDFTETMKAAKDDVKKPYFKGDKNYIIKIKTKYLEENQKTSLVVDIDMKFYSFDLYSGYYVTKFKLSK